MPTDGQILRELTAIRKDLAAIRRMLEPEREEHKDRPRKKDPRALYGGDIS